MFVSSSDRLNGRVLLSNSFNTRILFEVGLMPDFDRMDSVAVIYVFFFFGQYLSGYCVKIMKYPVRIQNRSVFATRLHEDVCNFVFK